MLQFEQKKEIEEGRFRHEGNIETFRSIIQFALGALKSAFIVNGGSCISWLVLMGAIYRSEREIPVFLSLLFSEPLVCFSKGLLLTVCAHGISYITQVIYMEARALSYGTLKPTYLKANNYIILGDASRVVTIILICLSYWQFYNGIKIAQLVIKLIH